MKNPYSFYYDIDGTLKPSQPRVKITHCKDCGKKGDKFTKAMCQACYKRAVAKLKPKRQYYRTYNK